MDLLNNLFGKKEEPKKAKAGGHGSHWACFKIFNSEGALQDAVMASVKLCPNPIKNSKDGKNVFGYEHPNGPLCTFTISLEGPIITSYPFAKEGIVHEVMLKEIIEWTNGLEAQLKIGLGPATLGIFDAEYFANYSKYQIGKIFNFSLSAIAYRLYKVENPTAEMAGGQSFSKDFAGIFPFKEGDLDDYLVRTKIKNISVTQFLEEKVYVLEIPLYYLEGNTSKPVLVKLYASETSLGGYTPKIGGIIQGPIWLQGHLV